MTDGPPLRFAVVGANHNHIEAMIRCVTDAGGAMAAWHVDEDRIAADFATRHDPTLRVGDPRAIFEDAHIDLVLSAAVPDRRASIAIEAMRHGKHAMVDKPGATTAPQLASLRQAQTETGRRFFVYFTERFKVGAMQRATDLVRAGAIGTVLQTVGLGPHRLGVVPRPAWFFDPNCYGGILIDLASHQMDHFLHYTGSTRAEVIAAQAGNLAHPDHDGLQDFGEAMVRGDQGTGYCRVDWFTPDGLGHWGDGRLTILGTDGTIEVHKNMGIDKRPGGSHLTLVDRTQVRRFDGGGETLRFGSDLLHDLADGTEEAQAQTQCFLACDLALQAQAQAAILNPSRARHRA